MRIARASFILTCVGLVASQFVVVAQQPKYGVTVQTSKPDALAKAKTYVWTRSNPALDKKVDALIVAAVDRELGARGFAKLPSGQSDVQVTYASVSRTDVDLKSKVPKGESPREFAVGTLIVALTDPMNREVLFRVRMDTPIEKDPVQLEAGVNAAVTAMFDKYPAPSKR